MPLSKKPTQKELTNSLLRKYKTTQDSGIKEELISQWGSYVRWIAERFTVFLPTCIDMEDIISQGTLGLIKAIDTFDLSKGVEFKTYAFFRIKGVILDELRALDWKPRSIEKKVKKLEKVYAELEERLGRMPSEEEVSSELKLGKKEFYKLLRETRSPYLISLEAHPNWEYGVIRTSEPDILSILQEKDIKRKLVEAMDELPRREKLLITLYYYEDMTLKEIGKVMGLSESRISQIHMEILLHFKNVLKKLI